jgi:hypothetical protein
MIMSAEAVEVVAYLKTCTDQFVSLGQVCRRASSRRRYEESPVWAKGAVAALVEAKIIEVNQNGHYRLAEVGQTDPSPTTRRTEAKGERQDNPSPLVGFGIVGDNYLPKTESTQANVQRAVEPEVERQVEQMAQPTEEVPTPAQSRVVGDNYFPVTH